MLPRAEDISRHARDDDKIAVPPKWVEDMYDCWSKKDTAKCTTLMVGDRSSSNSTIPEADTVETFMGTKG